MYKSDEIDFGLLYEPSHIEEVLNEIETNFPAYFASMGKSPQSIKKTFEKAIEDFEKEQPSYQEIFDSDGLEEYEDDPNAFKRALKTDCPLIRRCLNSPADEMKKYKISFNSATGQDLLGVTKNIVTFGQKYMEDFDDESHELCETVDDLGLGELLEDDYRVVGVIGGGIQSHFLFSLYPNAFPNRSQYAVWALYFLTDKKDFGFEESSEFLLIDLDVLNDLDKSVTQQNYYYPYDLFCFYALKLYLMLKEACAQKGYYLQSGYRYVYLDAFLNRVAETHEDDINCLKGKGEYEYTG